MIPEPDYSDEESDSQTTQVPENHNSVTNNVTKVLSSELKSDLNRIDNKGMVLPRKLPNPCLESSDKKNLHRELMFNQKLGINVLNQKSELQKAMEKHKGKAALKEQQKEKEKNVTPLQKAIDERAQRLEKLEKSETLTEVDDASATEFQKAQAKFRSKLT